MQIIGIVSLAIRLVWKLIKIEIVAGVLIGVFVQQFLQAFIDRYSSVDPNFFDLLLAPFFVAYYSWEKVGILALILMLLSQRKLIRNQREDFDKLKIGVVTIMDYFKLQTQVDAQKVLQEKGMTGVLKQAIEDHASSMFFSKHDHALTAKAMRGGQPIDFRSDINKAKNSGTF